MIVEFFGESGCGKSTLVNAITSTENINIKKRAQVSNGEAIRYFLKNIYKKEYRSLFMKLYGMLLASFKQKRIFKNALYVMKLLELHFLNSEAEEIVLFDQGLLQLFISAFFYENPKNDNYQRLITLIIEKFHLSAVYCECPKNILEQRIILRGKDSNERTRRIEKSTSEGISQHHEMIFERIVERIPEKRILRIDTSDDIENNRKTVIEWIGGLKKNEK